jgi:hypothetical protein
MTISAAVSAKKHSVPLKSSTIENYNKLSNERSLLDAAQGRVGGINSVESFGRPRQHHYTFDKT